MINWTYVLYGYLGVCGLIAIYWIGLCAYHDLFVGPDHKFGYNYKNSLTYILLAFFACPGLNLLTFLLYAWIIISRKINGWVDCVKSF